MLKKKKIKDNGAIDHFLHRQVDGLKIFDADLFTKSIPDSEQSFTH